MTSIHKYQPTSQRRREALKAKCANTPAGTRPQPDTSELEGEIDPLVAPRQLYGLTQEEIEIVEGRK